MRGNKTIFNHQTLFDQINALPEKRFLSSLVSRIDSVAVVVIKRVRRRRFAVIIIEDCFSCEASFILQLVEAVEPDDIFQIVDAQLRRDHMKERRMEGFFEVSPPSEVKNTIS